MADKLKPKVVSMSLAATAGILYVACALLFAIAPQAMMGLFSKMFHGVDITLIKADYPIPVSDTIAGFVVTVVLWAVIGWLFAIVYNYKLAKLK